MRKLFKYLDTKEKGMAAFSIIFVVIQVWLDLKLPEYMSAITTLVESPGSQISDILRNGVFMLACAVGSALATVVTGYLAAKVAASLSLKLREQLFRHVMEFNSEELGRFSVASLITRATNDVTQVQTLVAMGLQIITKTPIMLVWGLSKIIGKQWQWTLATGGMVLLFMVVILLVAVLVLPKFKVIQQLTDDLNRITRENLSGIRVIRAYNAENYQQQKFEQVNSSLTNNNLFTNRVTGLLMPTMTFIISAISLVIYWIGAYLLNGVGMMERLPVFSDMVAFSQYAMQVIMAFAMLTVLFVMLPRVIVSVHRINEVLDTKVQIQNGAEQDGIPNVSNIEFRHVSFRYPGAAENVLEDISFTANRGDTIAIIGATGSGKSSLVNLVPRFYDVTEGEVLVDGRNVREYEVHALRKKIGYVSQKAVLFSGSVVSNITLGKANADQTKIDTALDVSQSQEFVSRMPGGVSANIAQGGSNVSGGQRQRLSIARAICKNPEIYIFDDSFSALDYKTDSLLRQALAKKAKDSIKLIVAQRIGTIRHADRIIVLEDGKIAGMGTHAELLESCHVYQEIARSQLSEEELKHA